MNKYYLKFFTLLLLFLVGKSYAQGIGSCDGFSSGEAKKSSLSIDKVIDNNTLKSDSKSEITKGKSNYLSSFKLLIPHRSTTH